AGQFGAWAPIGVEQSGGGYKVAWYSSASSQYTIWTMDGSGNFLSQTGAMQGNDPTLKAFELTLQQDLNGDGTIGSGSSSPPPPPTVIESAGATRLVLSGNNYYFYPNGGPPGPRAAYVGTPAAAGAFGAWAPVA